MSIDYGKYTDAILLAGHLRIERSVEGFGELIDSVSDLLESALQYNRREYKNARELSDKVSKFRLVLGITNVEEINLERYREILEKIKQGKDVMKEERRDLCVFLSELGRYCSEKFLEESRRGPIPKSA